MINGAAGPAEMSIGLSADAERLQPGLEGPPQRIEAARAADIEQPELLGF
jgi:hypothetical protein